MVESSLLPNEWSNFLRIFILPKEISAGSLVQGCNALLPYLLPIFSLKWRGVKYQGCFGYRILVNHLYFLIFKPSKTSVTFNKTGCLQVWQNYGFDKLHLDHVELSLADKNHKIIWIKVSISCKKIQRCTLNIIYVSFVFPCFVTKYITDINNLWYFYSELKISYIVTKIL